MFKALLPVSLMLSGLLVLLVALGVGGSPARAQGTSLERGVTATVAAAVAAFDRGDLPALTRLFTDQGFEDEFRQTKSQAASDPQFFGGPVTIRAVRNIMATDTGATATVDFEAGLGIGPRDDFFIFQGGI